MPVLETKLDMNANRHAHKHMLSTLGSHLEVLGKLLTRNSELQDLGPESLGILQEDIDVLAKDVTQQVDTSAGFNNTRLVSRADCNNVTVPAFVPCLSSDTTSSTNSRQRGKKDERSGVMQIALPPIPAGQQLQVKQLTLPLRENSPFSEEAWPMPLKYGRCGVCEHAKPGGDSVNSQDSSAIARQMSDENVLLALFRHLDTDSTLLVSAQQVLAYVVAAACDRTTYLSLGTVHRAFQASSELLAAAPDSSVSTLLASLPMNQASIASMPRDPSADNITLEAFVYMMKSDLKQAHFGSSEYCILQTRSALVSAWIWHHHGQAGRGSAKLRVTAHYSKSMEEQKPLSELTKKPSQVADVIVATVIILNAVVSGVRGEFGSPDMLVWEIFEYMFTSFFLAEMTLKLYTYGCKEYFLGKDWHWNSFDGLVVFIAVFDTGMEVCYSMSICDSIGQGPEGLSVLRMVRLTRLVRLVRLLRFRMFKELKMMVQGVFAGLRVLFWAIFLFFAFLYILGVIMRDTLGSTIYPTIYTNSFMTMQDSMFTLFRCFTDGCTAIDGTPLPVHLARMHGPGFMFAYLLIFLFVTIGLFNLIMAIFVDNVMESTRLRKLDSRGEDRHIMQVRLRTLLENEFACANEFMDEIVITRDVFYAWLHEPEMQRMLEDLDIAIANKHELFDVLDADLSGELGVDEVITGLMMLRGPAEKSDIVATLLCTRVVLQTCQEFETAFSNALYRVHEDVQNGFALIGVDIRRHTPL